jgi:hypothetical protein
MKWFLCAAILLTLVACSDKKNVSKANPSATPTVSPTAPPYPTWHPCFGGVCPPTPVPTPKPVCTGNLTLAQLRTKVTNNEFPRYDGTFEVSFRVNWENYLWKGPYDDDHSWRDPYFYDGEFLKSGNFAYKITFNKDSSTAIPDRLPLNSWGSNVICGGLCGDSHRFEKPPFKAGTYLSLKNWLLTILSENKLRGWDSCGRSLTGISGYVIDPAVSNLPASYTYYLVEHETGDWFVISPDLPIELNPVIANVWTRRPNENSHEVWRYHIYLNNWTRTLPAWGLPIQGHRDNIFWNEFIYAVPYIYWINW